jgi:hypothetical protein
MPVIGSWWGLWPLNSQPWALSHRRSLVNLIFTSVALLRLRWLVSLLQVRYVQGSSCVVADGVCVVAFVYWPCQLLSSHARFSSLFFNPCSRVSYSLLSKLV